MGKIVPIIGVILLLTSAVDLHASERDFFDIAGRGTLEETLDAIANGADVNMRTKSGITPLMDAAHFKNDLGVVCALLSNDADVNAADENGMTSIIYAQIPSLAFFKPKHNDILELACILLDAGANLNAKSNPAPPFFSSYPDLTVLMWATIYNRVDVVKLLIDRGVRIDARNSLGQTAYDLAVKLRLGRVADVLFFSNNAFKQNLASVLYICLEIFPFLSCLVWLYRRFILRFSMNWGTLFASLLLGISWLFLEGAIIGVNTFSGVPLIKKICLLLSVDCMTLWRWTWTWKLSDGASKWSPFRFEGKIILSFLFTCMMLIIAWIVDPWI